MPPNLVDTSQESINSEPLKDSFNYYEDIKSNLRERERLLTEQISSQLEQTDLTDEFRSGMIGWMIDTQIRLKLETETLFMAIGIINNYLKLKAATQYDFVKLCFSSIVIASKYINHRGPRLSSFLSNIGNSLAKDEAHFSEVEKAVNKEAAHVFNSVHQ